MEITFLSLFLVLSIILGSYLAHRFGAPLSFSEINFCSWYIVVELIAMGALSTFFIRNIYQNNWALKIIPQEEFPLEAVTMAISWCLIGIPLGFLLANIILDKFRFNNNFKKFKLKNIVINNLYFLNVYFWLIISILYTAYTIYKVGEIPQLNLLRSGVDLDQIRGNLTHSYPANNYLKELIGFRIVPILSFSMFITFFKDKNIKNFILFLCFFLITVFYVTLNLNKSGLPLYLLGFLFATSFLSIKISYKHIIPSLLILFVMLILSYSKVRGFPIKVAAKVVVDRIIISQSYGNYLSFYAYPKYREHIGFHSTSKLLKKFNIDYKEPSSRELMKLTAPERVKEEKAGYMVSHFFAEAWANWGMIGLIFSPLFVGFFIKFLIGILMNIQKNPVSLGVVTYVSYNLGLGNGFNQFIFPRYLILTAVLLSSIYFIFNYLNRRLKLND